MSREISCIRLAGASESVRLEDRVVSIARQVRFIYLMADRPPACSRTTDGRPGLSSELSARGTRQGRLRGAAAGGLEAELGGGSGAEAAVPAGVAGGHGGAGLI